MTLADTLSFLTLSASTIILVALVLYGWHRRGEIAAPPFTAEIACTAFWGLCLLMQMSSPDETWAFFWARLRFLGNTPLAVFYFLRVLESTGYSIWNRPRRYWFLFIIPLITNLIVWSDRSFDWFFVSWSVVREGLFYIEVAAYQGWAVVPLLYSYVLLGIGFVLIVREIRRTQGGFQRQALLLFLAALVPVTVHVLFYLLDLDFSFIRQTPTLLAASALVNTWALLGGSLLHVIPAAHSTILDTLNVGVVVIDKQDRVISVNTTARPFAALKSVKGKPIDQVFPAFVSTIDRYRTRYDEVSDEFMQHVDNERRYWAIQIRPVFRSPGRLAGRVVMVQEITGRKRTEEQLRLLERAANSSPAGMVIVTNGGVYPAIYVNDTFLDITGYAREDFIGHGLQFLQRTDHDQPGLDELRQALREERPAKLLVRAYRKDGSLFWNEIWIAPVVNAAGKVEHFITTQMDVSERVAAEAQEAKLIERIAMANRELKDFAYVISHDLRAPLRGVNSIAHWLVDEYADKLDAEGKELIDLLLGRVQRMEQMINGVLEYARIGHDQTMRDEVDVRALIDQIVQDIVPADRIQTVIETPLPTLYMDAVRLRQVFQNLIDNAVKYMDKPQGEIRIGAQRQGAEWRFWVRDNGVGIPPNQTERIFQMFQTLSSPDQTESTGMGLPLVKRIVELNNGRVWVTAPPEGGSSYEFTLPAALADPGRLPVPRGTGSLV